MPPLWPDSWSCVTYAGPTRRGCQDICASFPRAGDPRHVHRLTIILPEVTLEGALETTRIHSVAGLTGDRTALVTTRPCRAPIIRFPTRG
jgi:hypothetical protein